MDYSAMEYFLLIAAGLALYATLGGIKLFFDRKRRWKDIQAISEGRYEALRKNH